MVSAPGQGGGSASERSRNATQLQPQPDPATHAKRRRNGSPAGAAARGTQCPCADRGPGRCRRARTHEGDAGPLAAPPLRRARQAGAPQEGLSPPLLGLDGVEDGAQVVVVIPLRSPQPVMCGRRPSSPLHAKTRTDTFCLPLRVPSRDASSFMRCCSVTAWRRSAAPYSLRKLVLSVAIGMAIARTPTTAATPATTRPAVVVGVTSCAARIRQLRRRLAQRPTHASAHAPRDRLA